MDERCGNYEDLIRDLGKKMDKANPSHRWLNYFDATGWGEFCFEFAAEADLKRCCRGILGFGMDSNVVWEPTLGIHVFEPNHHYFEFFRIT